ncbi:protein FAM151B-like [Ctenocephalides felis]|uniref:protein FAM151B-like n=1 Tax=Ctenocephalides felis TaxID=7515 RepID=UPI000E6E1528|nr:protein FAM151B-like [Ctenocephalides felis]
MAAAAVGIGSRRQKSDGDEDTSRCGSGECAKVDQAKSENCGRYTPDFFNMGTNLAGITWAHAVNSKTLLDNALRDKAIMMLEADVIIGTLPEGTLINEKCNGCVTSAIDNKVTSNLPVMGHPPATNSDLSLEVMLKNVIAHNREYKPGGPKGLKLDFKTIEAFEASLPILIQYYPKIEFPLWLNADILPGPGEDNDKVPVDAHRFLRGASNFPTSKLSLGWTTRYGMDYPSVTQSAPPDLVSYKKQHMTDMLSLLQSYVDNRNVTFPVRAGLAANCSELMLLLLQERPTYTLTIWSAEKDFVDYVKLNSLLQQVGTDRFYLDVPKILSEKLKYV